MEKLQTTKYSIVDIDLWECDAYLLIEGKRIYFQFSSGREPTLRDALEYLEAESKL